MAAPSGKLSVTIAHGSNKHKVEVVKSDDGPGGELTVLDLLQATRKVTGVPIHAQKLIYKGKSLSDPEQGLHTAGLKEGCKVMMIGRKSNPEEDANRSAIIEEEKKTETTEKKQNALKEELEGIEKGFLQKDLVLEAYQKLQKRLAICHEEYMKMLEKLDAMNIPEEQRTVRSNRKELVKRIQVLLDHNDELSTRIKEGMVSKGHRL